MSSDKGKVILSIKSKKKKKRHEKESSKNLVDEGRNNLRLLEGFQDIISSSSNSHPKAESKIPIRNFETTRSSHGEDDGRPPLVIPVAPNRLLLSSSSLNPPAQKLQENDDDDDDAVAAQALEDDWKRKKQESSLSLAKKSSIILSSKDTTFQQKEQAKYKKDLEELPDTTEEQYDNVPIEQFGAALLRGMGWSEETTNTSKRNEEESMPRPHRLGLGAAPVVDSEIMDLPSRKRPRTQNQVERDERREKQQRQYQLKQQQQIKLDKQRTLQNGSLIHLRGGKRAKLVQLQGVPGLSMIRVQLEGDSNTIVVKRGEMQGLVSREELARDPFVTPVEPDSSVVQPAQRKSDESQDHRKRNERNRDRESSEKESKLDKKSKRSYSQSWATPNIRVRIISEKLGSKYFKEKATVMDVTSKGITLRIDHSGRVLDRVPERYLETSVPKVGGSAIILSGPHKYSKGRLLERKSKEDLAVIQTFEDMHVVSLSLDDIAEWCGPLDDDLS